MDVRRELSLIRKNYKEYHRTTGESVVWFEFIPFAASASAGSYYDPVYDEGIYGSGGRKYKPGITIPVLLINETEDQKRSIPEGRQPVELTNFVASIEDMRSAGITDPFEYKNHLNDMFLYDGRYFTVTSYRVRGRARDDLLAVVEGLEVYINQEMEFDPGPSQLSVNNLPWPNSFANL